MIGYLEPGIWNIESEIYDLGFGVSYKGSGIWNVESEIYQLEFEVLWFLVPVFDCWDP